MATVIETPPQPKQDFGCCLGKGCLILVVFILLLAVFFVVGGYIGTRRAFTSTTPRELPVVATSPEEQQAVRQRWDDFQNAVQNRETPPAVPQSDANAQPSATPVATTSANPTIQFSANDINQLISANRKARGKAFVSIANDVGQVEVSIPLDKLGYGGRFLNANFEVRSSPDGDPGNIQITTKSLTGAQVPGRILNFLLGFKTVRGYADSYINQYRSEYQISKFKIEGGSVMLEAGRAP